MRNELAGFSVRLTEKMAERGMTQAELCKLTGLASSMVSHYCTGKRVPSVKVAVKIAKALRTTVEQLASEGRPKTDDDSGRLYDAAEKPSYNRGLLYFEHDEDERSLYHKFCSLNMEGQVKTLEYIEDLQSTGRYS